MSFSQIIISVDVWLSGVCVYVRVIVESLIHLLYFF
jgi:hypothetical protein